jgi:hypothetical protein
MPSKKYNLTVPEELAARIESEKERINLSELFRKAVTKKLDALDANKKSMENGMEAIVARLKEQKQGSLESHEERGQMDGIRWAKHACYDDLAHVGESLNPTDAYENFDANQFFGDEIIGDYFREEWKIFSKSISYEWEDAFTDREKAFGEGWFNGVKEFWDEISSRVNE